jgi:hypothetical protein
MHCNRQGVSGKESALKTGVAESECNASRALQWTSKQPAPINPQGFIERSCQKVQKAGDEPVPSHPDKG